ncbi:hypothetical protein AJ80_06559 [Polytolypa hystricis UAMH7299]|uniref:Uncharacterized protein n=1 Tax=Polytolypa hystricis (strain UAMH7299) TaxID=1447883 RepID=A0A2B7XV21_POLH7|nr:hypothetical protein AJ80_06559 [Polytolypa hystricis UAMH7299]
MDRYPSKKRALSPEVQETCIPHSNEPPIPSPTSTTYEEESTDFKLAILASLHPNHNEESLLEALLLSDGSVEQASATLKQHEAAPSKKRPTLSNIGYQSSLSSYISGTTPENTRPAKKLSLTKKTKTIYLYTPEDVEAHTPCSIIHNLLPPEQADALLRELLKEAATYERTTFQLFDKVVKSPHTFCFYVNGQDEVERQKAEFYYDGKKPEHVRCSTPEMLKACAQVEEAVNKEAQRRIQDFYPEQNKLKYQSPDSWKPNTAFVNCYAGPQENLGYHSDQLTYLGPRAIVGSLSLGVSREFRVRKIVAEDDEHCKDDGSLADAQGQISIHLPHNSLLVMHAEMQEEWKHSVAPARTIDMHPISKNTRINITYREYKEYLHPKLMPKCKCGVPAVLRCVQRKRENRGRYMWMCQTNYVPGKGGCSFFQWVEFDDNGLPPWVKATTDQKSRH